MRIEKLTLAACAAALLFTACGNSSTPERASNTNASPTPAVAQGGAATPAPPDELTQARADYGNFCIRCHKEDGTGGPFEMDDGNRIKVPSLREHGRRDSDAELAEHIADGGDDMPAFKDRLDEKRINGLVKFIRVEFHGQTAGGTGSAPDAGSATSPVR
jgi:mono/diheme cytochrome c family protein